MARALCLPLRGGESVTPPPGQSECNRLPLDREQPGQVRHFTSARCAYRSEPSRGLACFGTLSTSLLGRAIRGHQPGPPYGLRETSLVLWVAWCGWASDVTQAIGYMGDRRMVKTAYRDLLSFCNVIVRVGVGHCLGYHPPGRL